MRSRGSYRIVGSNGISIKTKVNGFVENFDEEVIDIDCEDEPKAIKRSKTEDTNTKINGSIITIDIDDDIDDKDIEMIDSDVVPTVSSKNVIFIEEKKSKSLSKPLPTKPLILKRCDNCLKKLMVRTEDFEYNRLTSADFYNNPRIHPSVVSIELKDRQRLDCFEQSILRNKDIFKEKTVLVIGSGTGLLALIVAKAMAKNVFIFDSAGIRGLIDTVIDNNRSVFPNKKTKFFVINTSIEDYVLPNGINKVDIIVSDWVNHSLFYKSMIKSFIFARNKWLRKGGLVFPDVANLYIAGAHDYVHRHTSKDKRRSESQYIRRIDYWDHNVYGFNMTAIRGRVLREPIHENIAKSQVITNEFLIKSFDLYKISSEDINFSQSFSLKAIENHYLQTYVLFFDIVFSKNQTIPIMYSTRPTAYKHMFRPTVLFIESSKQLTLEKDDQIDGNLKYSLSPDMNSLSFEINYKLNNKYFDVNEELFYSTK